MQGTGYPCDEDAESPVRKSETSPCRKILPGWTGKTRRVRITGRQLEPEQASPVKAEAMEKMEPQVEKLPEPGGWARKRAWRIN